MLPLFTVEANLVTLPKGRSAGILVPLFSLRSERSWGVGEFPDIGAAAPWLDRAGLPLLMMLPLVEAALGQDSPYAALSAFALDPVYVRLDDVPDFRELGGEDALSPEERRDLEAVRARETVDYPVVRRLKTTWLQRSFRRFRESGAAAGGERAADLQRFREEQGHWRPDYLLFRALKEAHNLDWWKGWGDALRTRQPAALEAARREQADAIAFFEYVQWIAFRQLAAARAEARRHGVGLAGDLPFMVAEDSADVWARQDEFLLDATVGVPPDAFSADGQDWGLPVYRWDVLASRHYDWLRLRGQRSAQLFDLVRIDHVVGFYRTYARPRDKSEPYFIPPDEPAQRRQGEAVMNAFRSAGVDLCAEDLGVVPPFVRESLTSIHVPGYRVLRWEKDDEVFRDPDQWPALSLATTGTHDTEPVAVWWDNLPEHERRAALEIPALRHLVDFDVETFNPHVHQAILEAVYRSGSDLLVLPVQDVFGLRERINLPGTVGPDNWTYRLPWTLESLATNDFVQTRTRVMAELAHRFDRTRRVR